MRSGTALRFPSLPVPCTEPQKCSRLLAHTGGDLMSGHIDPSKEQFAAFKDLPRDGAIHMLNLIRLRTRAAYPDGRQATGLEAYRAYGRATMPIIKRLGAKQFWVGSFEQTLIGPADERWDLVFVMEYPSADALITMLRDPEYR